MDVIKTTINQKEILKNLERTNAESKNLQGFSHICLCWFFLKKDGYNVGSWKKKHCPDKASSLMNIAYLWYKNKSILNSNKFLNPWSLNKWNTNNFRLTAT